MHEESQGGTVFSCGLLLKVPAFKRMKHRDILYETINLRSSHTASLCLFMIKPWMFWFWHLRSTHSHVLKSEELHIGHVLDGKRVVPKKSCLQKFAIYYPIWNLIRHVFCESVMFGFFQ